MTVALTTAAPRRRRPPRSTSERLPGTSFDTVTDSAAPPSLAGSSRPLLRWCDEKAWGDALNPVLFTHLSGVEPQYVALDERRADEVYMMLGSILASADATSVVWGPGFISSRAAVTAPPRSIHAVRGPLSRDKLLEQGVPCPEVYGDPALLYPLFYRPPAPDPRYELGVIPHYVDKRNANPARLAREEGVLLIDVEAGATAFVDQVLACERIASSSLHGLVAADAYGRPAGWLRFSNRVLGGSFKFHDYFLSVGRPASEPLVVTRRTPLAAVFDAVEHFSHSIPTLDLSPLLRACPFLAPDRLPDLLRRSCSILSTSR